MCIEISNGNFIVVIHKKNSYFFLHAINSTAFGRKRSLVESKQKVSVSR